MATKKTSEPKQSPKAAPPPAPPAPRPKPTVCPEHGPVTTEQWVCPQCGEPLGMAE